VLTFAHKEAPAAKVRAKSGARRAKA